MANAEALEMDAEIKARVPLEIRQDVERIARARLQSVSDIVRAASIEYVARWKAEQVATQEGPNHAA